MNSHLDLHPSRRDVLALLMAGGVASLAGPLFAATPRRGGRIKVAGATAALSDTLDPAKCSNHTDYIRSCMFYNGLTSLDGSLTPQPSLAEEFSTKDAKTWVFKLRQGVTFHDGKPFTPADVVFSIMRHKDPSTGSKAKVLAEQIEVVKATGPHEVTIRLVAPNADLPAILALPYRARRHYRRERAHGGHRHRPVQAEGIQAGRAFGGRAQRELLEAEPPLPGRD